MVAPANTTLETFLVSHGLAGHGDAGRLFDDWSVEGAGAATLAALERFDDLADAALMAAGRWSARHGPDRTLDASLAL